MGQDTQGQRDRKLDTALNDTFPASDPVSAPRAGRSAADVADAAFRAWSGGRASGDFTAFGALLAPELEARLRDVLGAGRGQEPAQLGEVVTLSGPSGWFVFLRESGGHGTALALRVEGDRVAAFREYSVDLAA